MINSRNFRLPAILCAFAFAVLFAPASRAAGNFQLGVGANYWYSLEDAADKSFERDGLGWMISSRWMLTDYFGFGLEVERSPDNFVELEEPMYAPSASVVIGKSIYAALGIGIYYYDGEFYEDTFYYLRAGLALELIPCVIFDLNVNYRFDSFSEIEDVRDNIDTDTLMAGAAIRIKF